MKKTLQTLKKSVQKNKTKFGIINLHCINELHWRRK